MYRMQIAASSTRSILDSVATRIEEAREITRYIVNLLIFLGLLGTFYGLATTVPSLVETIRSLAPQDGESGFEVFNRLMNVISIASPGEVFDKVISNAQEAKARDSYLIGIAPECNGTEIFDYLMKVPSSNEWISPLLNILPLQLLSYHIAAHRGLDVDQPRNLAKSVTVE